jgi:hypothetical protein
MPIRNYIREARQFLELDSYFPGVFNLVSIMGFPTQPELEIYPTLGFARLTLVWLNRSMTGSTYSHPKATCDRWAETEDTLISYQSGEEKTFHLPTEWIKASEDGRFMPLSGYRLDRLAHHMQDLPELFEREGWYKSQVSGSPS